MDLAVFYIGKSVAIIRKLYNCSGRWDRLVADKPLFDTHMNPVIEGRWTMGNRVGSGSFGCIYEGMDVITRCPVAIKCEPVAGHRSSLSLESRVYNLLKGTPGFADVFYYGSRGDLNILITELLGKSLITITIGARNRNQLS